MSSDEQSSEHEIDIIEAAKKELPPLFTNPHNKVLDADQFSGDDYRCFNAVQAGSGKFNAFRFAARFELVNIEDVYYPEEEMMEIFRKCLDFAKEGAMNELDLTPNHFIVSVDSHVLDYAINTHLKQTDESSIQELFTFFYFIDQSNKDKGRDSVTRAVFTVDVLAVQTKGTKRPPKRKLAGAGKHNNFEFNYKLYPGTLFNHPPFPPKYCLFYSLEWCRQKHLLSEKAFYNWSKNPLRQQSDVYATMKYSRIARGQKSYSIYDCGRFIQEYYDSKHPGTFRIIVFETSGDFKPTYKSGVYHYDVPLVLLHFEEGEGHYEPVSKPGRIFMEGGQYCFPCGKPYQDKAKHRMRCKGRCKNCSKMYPFSPCPKSDDFWESCLGCCKTFTNYECYERHLTRRRKGCRSVCERSKKCPYCGVYYTVKGKAAVVESDEEKSMTLGSKDSSEDEELEDENDSFINDEEEMNEEEETNKDYASEQEEIMDIDEKVCTQHELPATSKACADFAISSKVNETRKPKKKPDHVCGERYCMICKQRHMKRNCWMTTQPRKPKDRRIIVYDFESTQFLQPDTSLARFQHQVNFVHAIVTCYRCIDAGIWDKRLTRACEICGENRTFTWASFDYPGSDEHVHTKTESDEEILPNFVDWLLHFEQRNTTLLQANNQNEKSEKGKKKKKQEKAKRFETICYAHNGSRYDHIFVFGEIVRKAVLTPTMIRQGNTLLEMKVRKTGLITQTTFRDTLKIIPIGLAKFVKTFDLHIPGVGGKQYFPYKFNKPENYGKQLTQLPEKEFYSPDSMFPKEREEFLRWYEENKYTPFLLKDVLADYCISDVKILMHGLVKMRQLFKDVTGCEITESITLPSALMRFFVGKLPEHQPTPGDKKTPLWVALTPHLGYDKHDKQSGLARKYIKYWADKHNYDAQFCESEQGEYEYNGYKIDCFVRRQPEQRDLVMEVFGCYWHACPRCYRDENKVLGYGEAAWAIRKRDAKRIAELEKEFEVKIKWECDLRKRLIYKDEMRDYFEKCLDTGPIDLHEAFFGGRTSCEWISVNNEAHNIGLEPNNHGHRTIKYKDFVSLYPFVNYSCRYPIKHPETKTYNAYNGLDVNWTDPSHIVCPETKMEIKGIVKCFIVPPMQIKNDIAAIPYRINNHLLFPLCRTCADKYAEGLNDKEYSCEHRTDNERGFVATLVTAELEMALKGGYRVSKLIRCWKWTDDKKDWSESFFQPYIRLFMKIKYEASGWPEECLDKNITEEERAKRKQKVIDDACKETGIVLDLENMEVNPGLRYLAKICLNSLWGRFALRNRLTKSALVRNAEGLADYLDNENIDISMIEPLTENCWLIAYKDKEMSVVENYASNPIIALHTTAYARCHLLKHLWMLNENGRSDCRILYMDTDSVIYDYETRLGDPLPEGSQIGQLKDEYPSKEIIDFLALGPKAYMLQLRDLSSGKLEVVKKCRGISLNYNADARLQLERMREMVQNANRFPREENYEEFENKDRNFRITRRGEILTVPIIKHLRPTYYKGVLRGERIVPFGYVHQQ